MKQITIREARQALSRLDQVLGDEGEVTITKRGKAVARLVHLGKNIVMPSHSDLRSKMKRMKDDSTKLIRLDRDAR
jgi:antitoxin (DNA-binding transcriptional repressor) of toxin-antitoxin stability system